jgi:hypothetical protein
MDAIKQYNQVLNWTNRLLKTFVAKSCTPVQLRTGSSIYSQDQIALAAPISLLLAEVALTSPEAVELLLGIRK